LNLASKAVGAVGYGYNALNRAADYLIDRAMDFNP